MCSLCAALGASQYWTDAAGQSAFEQDGRKISICAERSRRVASLNRVLSFYGMSITDWGGNSYVLRDAQGRTQNMFSLTAIWAEAEAMNGQALDPLDLAFLDVLEAGTAGVVS